MAVEEAAADAAGKWRRAALNLGTVLLFSLAWAHGAQGLLASRWAWQLFGSRLGGASHHALERRLFELDPARHQRVVAIGDSPFLAEVGRVLAPFSTLVGVEIPSNSLQSTWKALAALEQFDVDFVVAQNLPYFWSDLHGSGSKQSLELWHRCAEPTFSWVPLDAAASLFDVVRESLRPPDAQKRDTQPQRAPSLLNVTFRSDSLLQQLRQGQGWAKVMRRVYWVTDRSPLPADASPSFWPDFDRTIAENRCSDCQHQIIEFDALPQIIAGGSFAQ